ncbi:MAG: c-type cytochrome [Opitutaceae bacterium]|nr:c-type cytochrome [Opitutaceae bacterium]
MVILFAACAPVATPPSASPEPAQPTGSTHVSIAKSPSAAIAAMQLQPGYRLETVVTEPFIAEPVLAIFDGNGRMYVAEMRTYMQDVDGSGKFDKVSRVSRHEDTNGDGNFDTHTVFADNLLLPRIVLPLKDTVIIGETNTLDLYQYRDIDGDGVSDERTLWFEGGPRGGNLEHQPNSLIWAMDNWLYATYNDYRLRYTADGPIREEIPANSSQWGLTQDNYGNVWNVNAGNETGPLHFQTHSLYGHYEFEDEMAEGFKTVWPIDNIPDTQGGIGQLRADNTLNHFTSTCGQDFFRGDRLPEDLQVDLIFGEPVGRLIRRTKITEKNGVIRLANAYHQDEFIRTTDPLFRPINHVTAPDGTLYIVDMYRGIIQEGAWTGEGSYLREQILAHDLEKEIGLGRIYRLTHEDFEPGPQPRMLEESPAQWVKHLSHPNGWWRDTAQKLLVIEQDQSVVPALLNLAAKGATTESRLHALWTLEGLGKMTENLVTTALTDSDLEVIKAGIRLAEPFLATSEKLQSRVAALLEHGNARVILQAMLSIKQGKAPQAEELAAATAETTRFNSIYAANEQGWAQAKEDPLLTTLLGIDGRKLFRRGKTFYNSLCFACHGSDGRGTPFNETRTIAPSLANSPRVLGNKQASINILLYGLLGDIDGVDYAAPMVPMASYSDEELAAVLTYVRNNFGNRSSAVTPTDIAAVRSDHAKRTAFWTLAELTETAPSLAVSSTPFKRRSEWVLDANFSPELLPLAVDEDVDTLYTTRSFPFPDQWLTIELPATSTIRSLIMNSGQSVDDYPPFYAVQISADGVNWSDPVVEGAGEPKLRLHFDHPITTRHLRFAITERKGWAKWEIADLQLYGDEG